MVPTRRLFLALLASAILVAPSSHIHAKDGGDDGGGDDSGHDDGHDDGGGRSKMRDDDDWSQDQALRERELGRLIPLETALRIVRARVRGRVIDVNLSLHGGRPQYRVKVRRPNGIIQTVRLDARTGQIIDFMGF